MNPHPLRTGRLAGLLLTLVLTLGVVWSIPAASLPGLGAPADDWFDRVGPAEGLLAALRIVTLAGLVYLLAATILILASTALRSRPLARVATRCTAPALQRFLRTSVGLGIGTVASLHPLAAGAAPPPEEESSDPVPAATAEPTADEITTLTRVDDPAPGDRPLRLDGPAEASSGSDTEIAPAPVAEPTDGSDWWTVAPGDHLWLIAEETLVDHGSTAPSPDDVARYWSTLCQANHDRLVDPDNPDLIIPGQRIVLPPVPVRP